MQQTDLYIFTIFFGNEDWYTILKFGMKIEHKQLLYFLFCLY